MIVLTLKMVVAGAFFVIYPLFLKKSGLTDTTSLVAFFPFVVLCVLPIAIKNGITLAGANWWFIIAAGCCSGIGLLLFMNALVKAPSESVGSLILIMTVAQIAILSAYQGIMSGHLTLKMCSGFVAAVLAAFLLS